jgi:hypothetical protein
VLDAGPRNDDDQRSARDRGGLRLTEIKYCFLNRERPCDLTCKAAFEVDDPVDNVDCYFIWMTHHFGEGLFELRRILENMGGFPGGGGSSPPAPPGKGPKGFPNN